MASFFSALTRMLTGGGGGGTTTKRKPEDDTAPTAKATATTSSGGSGGEAADTAPAAKRLKPSDPVAAAASAAGAGDSKDVKSNGSETKTGSAPSKVAAAVAAGGGGGGGGALGAGERWFDYEDVLWPWMTYSRYGGDRDVSTHPNHRIKIKADGQLVHGAFPSAGAGDTTPIPALSAACADIQSHIRGWGPTGASGPGSDGEDCTGSPGDEKDWTCFYVPHAVLVAAGLGGGEVTIEQIVTKLFDAPVQPRSATDKTAPVTLRVSGMAHSRKTMWPQHWYWYNMAIEKQRLAKIKAATSKIQKLCVKDSLHSVKFEDERTNTFGWGVMIIGRAKKGTIETTGGGADLIIVTYADGSEDHYHHGK